MKKLLVLTTLLYLNCSAMHICDLKISDDKKPTSPEREICLQIEAEINKLLTGAIKFCHTEMVKENKEISPEKIEYICKLTAIESMMKGFFKR